MKDSNGASVTIQVCNHNYLLADAAHRQNGWKPLLKDYQALVIDEAHKLPETVRQLNIRRIRSSDLLHFERILGHFTFHALRHTFATRALERGMDYKTLSAILGHYSVSFTMDTYVHSMDEHKRNEMDKMDDLFGISLEISVEQQPYPVLFTVTEEGCKAFAPDFPKIQIQAGTMETALMEAKKQIQKALSQFKYPPIPTRQEDIVVQENSVLILLKTA